MKIKNKNNSQALRAMTIAFKLSMSATGKSDKRRKEIRATAKKMIVTVESYVGQKKEAELSRPEPD